MRVIEHHGRTINTDLIFDVSLHGVYAAVGRLDGGINFRPADWIFRFIREDHWLIVGPFDIKWSGTPKS